MQGVREINKSFGMKTRKVGKKLKMIRLKRNDVRKHVIWVWMCVQKDN